MTKKLIGPNGSDVPETRGKNDLKGREVMHEKLPRVEVGGYTFSYEGLISGGEAREAPKAGQHSDKDNAPEGGLFHKTIGVYTPDIRYLEILGTEAFVSKLTPKGNTYRYEGKNDKEDALISVVSADGKILAQNVECPAGKETEIKVGNQLVRLTVTDAGEVSMSVRDIKVE